MVQFLQNEAMNESKELNRRMMMTALHFNGLFKNFIEVINFIMNKACLEFCRAT